MAQVGLEGLVFRIHFFPFEIDSVLFKLIALILLPYALDKSVCVCVCGGGW